MHRLPALCVALVAATLVACEKRPRTAAEVTQRVAAEPQWAADATVCPVRFMPARKRDKPLAELTCEDEALPGCFETCERGEVDSCYWLAFALQKKSMKDEAAQVLYQRACKLGEPSGCVNRAAGMLYEKVGDASVRSCAAQTFERACDLDDARGCALSSIAYSQGVGGPVDRDRAIALSKKACAIPGVSRREACQTAKSVASHLDRGGGAALPPGE